MPFATLSCYKTENFPYLCSRKQTKNNKIMKTLKDLKEHVTNIRWDGYGSYKADLERRGKKITVTFHDGEVYDRIRHDGNCLADTEKGTGGLTLRQAYLYIWRKGEDRW